MKSKYVRTSIPHSFQISSDAYRSSPSTQKSPHCGWLSRAQNTSAHHFQSLPFQRVQRVFRQGSQFRCSRNRDGVIKFCDTFNFIAHYILLSCFLCAAWSMKILSNFNVCMFFFSFGLLVLHFIISKLYCLLLYFFIPDRWRCSRQLINFPMVGSHPLDDSSNAVHICKRQSYDSHP